MMMMQRRPEYLNAACTLAAGRPIRHLDNKLVDSVRDSSRIDGGTDGR